MTHLKLTNRTAAHTSLLLGAISMALLSGCNTTQDEPVSGGQQQTSPTSQVGTIPTDGQVQSDSSMAVEEVAVLNGRVSVQEAGMVVTGSRLSKPAAKAQLRSPMNIRDLGDQALIDPYPRTESNTEQYRQRAENPFTVVTETPVSTFSIDVDSAAYANTRRFLNNGHFPPAAAIRSEEFINYFNYDYPNPEGQETPFSITSEIAPSPWSPGRHLLHIGLKGYEVDNTQLPAANLVFLIDVSGSMNSADKLGLLTTSLKLLTQNLRAQDRIAIAVYAGASGVVLEPTSGNNKAKIINALEQLRAGGSTNGGAGVQLAYQLAKQSFQKEGINRVILATDGDFNVGTTDTEALKALIKKYRNSGIELTTLGFGQGNYNDQLMNEIAEVGNGNAAYIDTILEARKALVEELSSTLFTIAKDVKVQIEFSPQVAEYRLIGYESRLLKREDFNNDKIDAGEIGAGHTVTALYEIVLANSSARTVDPLRYQSKDDSTTSGKSNELAYLKLRYKLPKQTESILVEQPIALTDIQPLESTSNNFRWSAAVAAFGQQLSDSKWINDFKYKETLQLAKGAVGSDAFGYRAEMIRLLKIADTLSMAHAQTESATDAKKH